MKNQSQPKKRVRFNLLELAPVPPLLIFNITNNVLKYKHNPLYGIDHEIESMFSNLKLACLNDKPSVLLSGFDFNENNVNGLITILEIGLDQFELFNCKISSRAYLSILKVLSSVTPNGLHLGKLDIGGDDHSVSIKEFVQKTKRNYHPPIQVNVTTLSINYNVISTSVPINDDLKLGATNLNLVQNAYIGDDSLFVLANLVRNVERLQIDKEQFIKSTENKETNKLVNKTIGLSNFESMMTINDDGTPVILENTGLINSNVHSINPWWMDKLQKEESSF